MAVLAAVLAVSVLLGGCQGRQDTAGTREETGGNGFGSCRRSCKGYNRNHFRKCSRGTGRFMEEEVSLPENFDAILDMEKLQDGRIRLVGFQWKEGEAEGSGLGQFGWRRKLGETGKPSQKR